MEVTNISGHGFWLLVDDRELFLSFEEFPWFKSASVEKIATVEWLHQDHLYWPALDIDLHLDSIEHPEQYPLRSSIIQPSSEEH